MPIIGCQINFFFNLLQKKKLCIPFSSPVFELYLILFLQMHADHFPVNCIQSPTKSMTSNKLNVQLLSSLSFSTITNKTVISYYQGKTDIKQSHCSITPIDFIEQENSAVIIYHCFGEKISLILDVEFETLLKQNFIKQVLDIYAHFQSLMPEITLENLYYLRFRTIKVLITDQCPNQEVYISNFKQIVKTVYKNDEVILERSESINSSRDILEWHANLISSKQAKTIGQLIQLKNAAPKIIGKSISLTEDDLKWIFISAGFADIPKYQLIYNGIENYFDPSPLLKSINKLKVFYFIQSSKGQKIAFFPAVQAQIIPNQLFGNYYADKQKKSVLLGVDKRSVHSLKDESNAVGYGQQILIAIGKLDFILSAFNNSNFSYFPMSYSKDNDIGTAQDLLGRQFTLRQFQAYKIS